MKEIYDGAQSLIKKETEREVEIFGGFGKRRIKENVEIKAKTKKKSVDTKENIKENAQRSLFDY